jgi:hypothetical protein
MSNYIQKIKKIAQEFFKDPLFLKRWEMPYYRAKDRTDNQLSVRVGYSGGRYYHYYGAGFDFVQHMYTGIVPFAHMSGQREKYPTKIEPNVPEKADLIAAAIADRGYGIFLADALYDFIRNTSHTLFTYGVALFEVVYEKDENGNITSFKFTHLGHSFVYRFFGDYYQIVPWWVAKRNHVKVQIVKIPAEKILKIKFPKKLGGHRKLKKTLKRLWKLSNELIPKFQMNAMEENKDIGFNLESYSKAKYLETAKQTSVFGWNQGQTSNYVTEYYWLLRYLREVKAQAIVRAEILSTLNNFLNEPLLKLGVTVSVENLLTVESIEEQERLMKAGNVNFGDIHKATMI